MLPFLAREPCHYVLPKGKDAAGDRSNPKVGGGGFMDTVLLVVVMY
jgi:hypothetical protein